jgi:DnaJ homolog subfamily C member 19
MSEHAPLARRIALIEHIKGRAGLLAMRRYRGGAAGALGKAYYKGGFEPKMNRREAALILQLKSVAPVRFRLRSKS